jgi:dehydrogenase/reductase SDR family protein 12
VTDLRQLRKIVSFYGRFLPSFSSIGYHARRLSWPPFAPDFSGQTWLVTGASGGIGRAATLHAARSGARVLAVARNAGKLQALAGEAPASIEPVVADLALVRQVRALVCALAARGERIDVLLNNVGVLLDDYTLTVEGREASLATNLLNHYLLTEDLLTRDLLARDGVVINMSSGGMYNVPLMVEALRMPAQAYNGVLAYGLHKRAQVVLTDWWRDRHRERGVRFYAMHPGWSDTEGVRTSLPRFRRLLRCVLRDEAQGADTALWLAARRPAQTQDELVWFDRKARPAHVFARTRASVGTPAELVALLEGELQRA